jgi:NAD(P)-dependent dehydrogenase (short-subunit alcohol dehydrogenase family)
VSQPIPDLQGRTFVVTGANSGIGRTATQALAARGARVLMLCRSVDKSVPVVEAIKAATGNGAVELIPVDLADLASVRDCARGLLARDLPIHGLINNAGLAGLRGVTKQGFEVGFGTNHLGHFLLTSLLLDRLTASAPARVVTVSSEAHYRPKRWEWEPLQQPTKTRTAFHEYGVSKLANVLFTRELARRTEGTGITTYALHPGVVATDVWRRIPRPISTIAKLFMRSSEDGAKTTLYCATAPELATVTGRYYDNERERTPSKLALDDGLARELWAKSEQWTAAFR